MPVVASVLRAMTMAALPAPVPSMVNAPTLKSRPLARLANVTGKLAAPACCKKTSLPTVGAGTPGKPPNVVVQQLPVKSCVLHPALYDQ